MACREQHPAAETCPQCEFDPFVRNHFFTGKLMGAADFTAESLFHGEKMRHHNIRLHGWGVVCGLDVRQHDTPQCRARYVIVRPGSAIDCCGHEILVPDVETVDVAGDADVQARTGDGRLHTLQVAACYRECPTEDVPVLYDDCGCDDTRCAPNRILESYALDVLVDPPLSSGLGGQAAAGAFVASKTAGAVTGFSAAGAGGRIAVVDPIDPTRVFVIDAKHRSMVTLALPAAALAVAMAQDGQRIFVATVPAAAGQECPIRIFKTVDGTEIGPANPRTVKNSTGAGVITLATTTDLNNRSLVAFDASQGKIYRWKDAAAGDIAAVAGSVAFVANATSFTALADGTLAFGIDAAAHVQVVGLGAGPATAALQWNPPRAAALSAFTLNGTVVVAIASADEKRVYLVEQQAGGAHQFVSLEHPPAALGVTGAAAAPWLEVLEEDAGHRYLQAISLEPYAAGQAPLVAAARSAGDADPLIVVLYGDGDAATVDPAAVADSDCADLVCKQTCAGCDVAECVVLATISNYLPGMSIVTGPAAAGDVAAKLARIDNRDGRRILASTATLQAWLECLQMKGGVPGPAGANGHDGQDGHDGHDGHDGQDGVVDVELKMGTCSTIPKATLEQGHLVIELPQCCDSDLAHICYINWTHAGTLPLTSKPEEAVLLVGFDHPILREDIHKHTFIVEGSPVAGSTTGTGTHVGGVRTGASAEVNALAEASVTCWCQLEGAYSRTYVKNPCKPDRTEMNGPGNAINFVAFKPARPFEDGHVYRVRILGDLIRDYRADEKKQKAIDANHLPPWVSGGRRTGDCIEGGTFFSYFQATRKR